MISTEFIKNHLRKILSIRLRVKLGLALRHRAKGYAHLNGFGLEIGALHNPAQLKNSCTVEYADAINKSEAMHIFPEINPKDLVDVQYIIELDKTGLIALKNTHYDFVIMNHVIEHVANPIDVLAELFRVVKKGGYVVISAPDKNYTFDRTRKLTTFAHLYDEYINQVKFVSDDHYHDFVKNCITHIDQTNFQEVQKQIQKARSRREHAHVWDSNTFEQFFSQSLETLGLDANLEYCSTALENGAEIFMVYKKR